MDAQVAAVAGRIGPAQLDRLVAETIKRYDLADVDPAADPEDGYLPVDPRHATIHDDDVHFAGTMRFEAELDIADALDLDRALAHGAETLKALGSDRVARRTPFRGPRRPRPHPDRPRPPRQVARGADRRRRPARRARGRPPRPLRRVRSTDWPPSSVPPAGWRKASGWSCSTRSRTGAATPAPRSPSSPSSTSTPSLAHRRYEIPDRIREQVILRDRTCVFPWCTRPARGCDIDHVIAYDHDAEAEGRPQPGPTQTDNLAALCRFHHRLKTHTAWRYRMTEPGVLRVDHPRTATTIDATAPAPRRSSRPRRTHPTSRVHADDDPAPHPARALEGGVVGTP